MKKRFAVLVLVLGLIIANTNFVSALQQAEVNPYDTSIAYGAQTLNGELISLNLEGDMGISSNIGIEGMYTYYKDSGDNKNIFDLNAKIGVVDKQDFDLSAIVGYHIKLDGDDDSPRVGFLVSKAETSELDLNAGVDFLLGAQDNYIGYTLGFDYKLTEKVYLEVEHRRFTGQAKTEGLNVGMRYYF
ncbi:hypothetical protein JCM16358_18970 [Halanaerocella petrolearia]